jgi:hypothetical protein
MPELTSDNDQIVERLDDQIRWYDLHSSRQRKSFYALKVITIVAAAAIPLLAAILSNGYLNKIVTSSLGALIVVIEGVQLCAVWSGVSANFASHKWLYVKL